MSFSVRETLSALKAVYQEAGVALALPDPPTADPNDPAQTRHSAVAASPTANGWPPC